MQMVQPPITGLSMVMSLPRIQLLYHVRENLVPVRQWVKNKLQVSGPEYISSDTDRVAFAFFDELDGSHGGSCSIPFRQV